MEIFQVADKGLNCARNIYAATKEADDGYIFSKSIHGRNLSEKEKKWLLLENDQNIWKDYRDKDGNLLYRLKSCIDNFSYQFKETDPVTGQDVVKAFSVTEKRIVSYIAERYDRIPVIVVAAVKNPERKRARTEASKRCGLIPILF